MIAVDTNVLVRLLTGDEPKQSSRRAVPIRFRVNLDRENGVARNRLGAPQPLRI